MSLQHPIKRGFAVLYIHTPSKLEAFIVLKLRDTTSKVGTAESAEYPKIILNYVKLAAMTICQSLLGLEHITTYSISCTL